MKYDSLFDKQFDEAVDNLSNSVEEFNGLEKDRTRQTRRENDLRVGKKNKKILKDNGIEDNHSDLYYKNGHIWADEEREFCCKVTKSKYNGFNPKISEQKKYDKLDYNENEENQ